MNKSSRVVISLVLLGVGVAVGVYGPQYAGDWWPGSAKPGAQSSAPAAGGGGSGGSASGGGGAARGLPVQAAIVESVYFPRGLSAIGSLLSDESTMVSAEVAGRITAIRLRKVSRLKKRTSWSNSMTRWRRLSSDRRRQTWRWHNRAMTGRTDCKMQDL